MDIRESERSGRHRLEHEGGAIWLPLDGGPERTPAPHVKPALGPGALPAQRTRDPLVDTDAVGLRKFNIGLVPASVTPPRTWKRAAWFAVVSSAAVLVGLAYAAAKLVGADSPEDRIGMPGYPTASPLITGFGTTSATPPPSGADRPEQRRADQAAAIRAGGEGRTGTGGAATDPTSAGSTGGTSTGGDTGGKPSGKPGGKPGRSTTTTTGPSSSPTVTTVPGESAPLVDAAAIALRTEQFFEEAVADADKAMAMVADVFRSDAEALLERRFSDVSLVQVTAITVDPASGVTVSTLNVTKDDGSTTTERRELVFTTAGEPLINAERLVGGA
ncbi:hypothetical protein ABZ816_21055 [Actinosynnema sp. NPDC047251]|uniref:Putative membrane protein n=1 Tax=Saccharothrix espanaensis (strain ATCC 51144 / DSM 44229 / JCM 9112 / NBRC 15066 / NRRL 15764) TaxID=1179773 RepID=K0KEW3_SACES|nr:hypothetical protein [Saccharothrix espanaensis]CCH35053.1 putative membrane protein [Saccharothrix espanaensis DSM 44229]